jgi:hypothetical protein
METIEEFLIGIPQAELDDLRDRLARTRWPDQTVGYGLTDSPGGQLAWIAEKFGRFAALEEPDLLIVDVREFFRPPR